METQALAQEIGISFQTFKIWLNRYGYFDIQPNTPLQSFMVKEAIRYFQRKKQENHSIFLEENPKVEIHPTEDQQKYIEQEKQIQHLKAKEQVLQNALSNLVLENQNLQLKQKDELSHKQKLEQQVQQYENKNQNLSKGIAFREARIDELELELDKQQQGHKESKINEELWRRRALELERQSKIPANQRLLEGIKKYCHNHQEPLEVLRDILTYKEAASAMLENIYAINTDGIKAVFDQYLSSCCVHPFCQQVCLLEKKIPIKVNHENECRVCHGSDDLRWFKRMAMVCKKSNLKSFLLIGGDDIHDILKQYLSAYPNHIDIRMISHSEEITQSRIEARLLTYNVLVLWHPQQYENQIDQDYEEICRQFGRQMIRINSPFISVKEFCKSVLYTVSRGITKV